MSECNPNRRHRLAMVLNQHVARVCVCDLCVKAARAQLSLTTGCGCAHCKSHRKALDALYRFHLPTTFLRVWLAPSSTWPEGHAIEHTPGADQ